MQTSLSRNPVFPYQLPLFDLGDIRNAVMFFNALNLDKLAHIWHLHVKCKLAPLHYTGSME